MFSDRNEAASLLAERLGGYRGENPLILAIPRGAVPMAKLIAERLGGELDVVLVRKLRAPYQLELAIGSVDEDGLTYMADYAESVCSDKEYIESERRAQLETIRKRRAQYSPIRPPIDPAGRIVIVVDDGLATGSTMISALRSLRAKKPAKLICAVPVAPPSTLEKVAAMADQVICLESHPYFQSVGQYYCDFPQVEDEEVFEILKQKNKDRETSMAKLTKKHIDALQGKMEAELALAVNEARAEMEPAQKANYTDLDGNVADSGDEAVADTLIDTDNAIIGRHLHHVNDLNDALERIRSGIYGTCIECDSDIGFQRLSAYPTAKRCMECQSRYEKTYASEAGPRL